MIRKRIPLSMPEATEYLDKNIKKEKELLGFIKKFTKIKIEEAKEIKKKLKSLDLMKLNEEKITKIIDIMPKKTEELNKIFIDFGLTEDETKKVLETIKEFK